MKKIYLFLAGILSGAICVNSQSIERSVIASAGNYFSSPGLSVSWTLGEAVTGTSSSPTLILDQGFQQTSNKIVGLINYQSDISFEVYPNPSSDQVFIKMNAGKAKKMHYSVYTVYGQQTPVVQKSIQVPEGVSETRIDFSSLASGNYLLLLRSEDGKQAEGIRIVKVN